MINKSIAAIGLCLIYSVHSYAANMSVAVGDAQAVGAFPVGIGSTVNLSSDDSKIAGPAVFLGNAVRADGTSTYQMYLNKNSQKAFYIESSNFNHIDSKFQTVLDPIEQAGGTCTGYAIYDFLQQTNLSGFEGSGELAKVLSNEEGRTNLLVDSVNQYYLVTQHRNSISGIVNGYGKKFGFTCKSFKTDSFEKAKAKILPQLKLGLPIIFSFNIGPNMVKAPFPIEMVDQKNSELDNRLWVPRKTGERNSGGHSIVAAGSFEMNNKTYLVMVDSDWSEPRIWDMELFLNNKTAIDEVEFISCK